MEKLLLIDACVRGEASRTRKLANAFLEEYLKLHPDTEVTRRDLCAQRMEPQYPEVLEARDALWAEGKLDDPMFDAAHQFADADVIVIAAPFWDLSYPAILKIYLERISVTNITFGYSEKGEATGMCKARKLLLVTTRGGTFTGTPLEMGYRHIQALCMMYGIPENECLYAEGMDDLRNDPEKLLADAMERGRKLAQTF